MTGSRNGRLAAARTAAVGVIVLMLLGGCGRASQAIGPATGTTQAEVTQTAPDDEDPTTGEPASATGEPVGATTADPGVAETTARQDTTDGLDAAPETLEMDGVTYQRVAAVPWFEVSLRGDQLAVTTGPDLRGACDTSFYRLTLGNETGQPVTLTSYEYAPAETEWPADTSCPAIGLPPAVATSAWPPGFADVTEVRDGVTGESHPIRRVLLPPLLPAGFTADTFSSDWPQVTDTARPAPFWTGGSWSGPAGRLALTEYAEFLPYDLPVEGRVDVRGVRADVVRGLMMRDDRCLSWADAATGNTMLCSSGAGGHPPLSAERLVQLADSLAA